MSVPELTPTTVAQTAARQIMKSVVGHPIAPGVYPQPNGGVTVEWGSPDLVVTVEIAPDPGFFFFHLDVKTAKANEVETDSEDEVVALVKAALFPAGEDRGSVSKPFVSHVYTVEELNSEELFEADGVLPKGGPIRVPISRHGNVNYWLEPGSEAEYSSAEFFEAVQKVHPVPEFVVINLPEEGLFPRTLDIKENQS